MRRGKLTLVLVAVVVVVGGVATISHVVVPYVANSGLAETLQGAGTVQQALMPSGQVQRADVRVGRNINGTGVTRTLQVNVVLRSTSDLSEAPATRVAEIILDHYQDIADVDALSIRLDSPTNLGFT